MQVAEVEPSSYKLQVAEPCPGSCELRVWREEPPIPAVHSGTPALTSAVAFATALWVPVYVPYLCTDPRLCAVLDLFGDIFFLWITIHATQCFDFFWIFLVVVFVIRKFHVCGGAPEEGAVFLGFSTLPRL